MRTHQTTVDVCPSASLEADAGTEITFTVEVSCPYGCDLREKRIQILAPDGTFTEDETSAFTIKAPIRPGEHVWRILFLGAVNHEASSTAVVLNVRPHKTSLAMWDLSSPILMNAPSTMKVGVKCAAGCELTGCEIEIQNHSDAKVAGARLGTTPWPGTTALYWTDVDFVAPPAEGNYSWLVRFRPAESELPHEETSFPFHFTTIKPPEVSLTVEIVERNSKTPVDQVEVRLDGHRASTNESGAALLEVAKGSYELNVWKHGYEALSKTLEITGDLTIYIELVPAPEPEVPYWMQM